MGSVMPKSDRFRSTTKSYGPDKRNTVLRETNCIFRKKDGNAIVFFERDNILLRRRSVSADLKLGDINREFIDVLIRLREQNVLFGFISDQRGLAGNCHGWSQCTTLTGILDDLLRVQGAEPDFWVTWRGSTRPDSSIAERNYAANMAYADLIMRVMAWYGADKNRAIFVGSSSATTQTANRADIAGFRYSSWPSGPIASRPRGTETPPRTTRPAITATELLLSRVEQMLAGGRRRTG